MKNCNESLRMKRTRDEFAMLELVKEVIDRFRRFRKCCRSQTSNNWQSISSFLVASVQHFTYHNSTYQQRISCKTLCRSVIFHRLISRSNLNKHFVISPIIVCTADSVKTSLPFQNLHESRSLTQRNFLFVFIILIRQQSWSVCDEKCRAIAHRNSSEMIMNLEVNLLSLSLHINLNLSR